MATIDDIIEMKNGESDMFGTTYTWFFVTIENDLISKLDGQNRVKFFLKDYDYKARLYVVYQFMKVNPELGNELFQVLELNVDNTFLDDKYFDELVNFF